MGIRDVSNLVISRMLVKQEEQLLLGNWNIKGTWVLRLGNIDTWLSMVGIHMPFKIAKQYEVLQ